MAPRARFELATLRLTAEMIKKSKCPIWCRLQESGSHFSFSSCTQCCTQNGSLDLQREVQAPQQVLEARVGEGKLTRPGHTAKPRRACGGFHWPCQLSGAY